MLSSPFPQYLRRGFAVFVVGFGFLLSPLCWWNDLFFNLPLAYFVGYGCSLFLPKLLVPGTIAGYWLSNLVGLFLIQVGAQQITSLASDRTNWKAQVKSGLVSSTVFTLVVVGLAYFRVLDLSNYLPSELFLTKTSS